MHQFVPKHVLAPPEIGLRGERADGVVRRLVCAESRLAAPDAQHHMARDTELALDFRERCLVLREQLAALCGEALELRGIEILDRRLGELGLILAERPRLTGQDEIGQRQVGNDTTKGRIEGSAGYTGGASLRPKRLDPGAEFFIRRGARARAKETGKPQGEQQRNSGTQHAPGEADICPAQRKPAPSRVAAPSVGPGDRSIRAPL